MRKNVPVALAVLLLLPAVLFAAQRHRPVFRGVEAVERDAATRLAATKAISAAQNSLVYEGDLSLLYLSGSFGALLMDTDQVRFACTVNTLRGCSITRDGDHLLIYGHLRAYFPGRFDFTDDEAVIDLIYRRIVRRCGDLTCDTWELLTTN